MKAPTTQLTVMGYSTIPWWLCYEKTESAGHDNVAQETAAEVGGPGPLLALEPLIFCR
jgi:hypothetical protein